MKKRTYVIIITVTAVVISLLWINGVIPEYIAKISCEKYVEVKYKDKEFEFLKVYWDDDWERYFVILADKSSNTYTFKMSKYIPSSIIYDPLDPPG